jgi:hypothetical protein
MAIKSKTAKFPKFLLVLALVILLGLAGLYAWTHWSRNEAIQTVEAFYSAEQSGDYGGAWTMLHSEMKKKFTQADYIQKRTSLFMDAYGAKTFSFEIDEVDHLKKWRMTSDDAYIKDVYKITVIQSFTGIFGDVKIYKDVFVAKEQNEWKILWQY